MEFVNDDRHNRLHKRDCRRQCRKKYQCKEQRTQNSAADLAICLAIASAVAGRKLSEDFVVFGEVGLGGEVRSAFRPDQRISEAKKLGFSHAIAPSTVKDEFVIPVRDLRTTLIEYVNE